MPNIWIQPGILRKVYTQILEALTSLQETQSQQPLVLIINTLTVRTLVQAAAYVCGARES